MRFRSFLPLLALGLLVPDAGAQRNVVLYIGDGYGVGPKTATRMALGQGQPGSRFSSDPDFQLLATDRMRYAATVTTHSANSWITDSAPGAFVYAAGQTGKIDNDVISFDLESGQPIETILEAAKKDGYMVGLVTSTRLTHATPAVFATHIWSRRYEDYIAAQYVSTTQAEYEGLFDNPIAGVSGADYAYDADRDWILPEPKRGVRVDVLMGGGARHFLPSPSACGTAPDTDPNGNAVVRDADGDPIEVDGAEVSFTGRRSDCVDVVQAAKDRGYTYVNSRDALLAVDTDELLAADEDAALLGLFNDSHTYYELERHLAGQFMPSLEEMTRLAIDFLEAKSEAAGNDKGFFLLVEGGRIDHLEHANAGGIEAEAQGEYELVANEETIVADQIYGSGQPSYNPTVLSGYYGSDYVIREVMAFDYAVQAGLDLMADGGRGETLVLQTSDHECGGLTAVGLNDAGDVQGNGSGIRTYAQRPTKANGENNANPETVVGGDAEIGGWFPSYTSESVQGRAFPVVAEDGRRIVISYGSNPLVNGNTRNAGVTPGNHTPADIRVAGDDNVGGAFASRLTGRGLLDNTDLFPIMRDFLQVELNSAVAGPAQTGAFELGYAGANPTTGRVAVRLVLGQAQDVRVELFDVLGRRVATLHDGALGEGALGEGASTVEATPTLAPGTYIVRAEGERQAATQKMTVVR